MKPLTADPFLAQCHNAVGGAPEVMGPWQLELMVRLGLHRDSSLLDLGCGTLRGGLHFIRYLNSGRYYGADLAPDLLDLGKGLVSLAGLWSKEPEIMSVDALDGQALTVDWVLTQSVLTHLDESGLVATVRRAARSLSPTGRWVSTVCFDSSVERVKPGVAHGRRRGEYWRSLVNPSWLREIVGDFGLVLEELPDAAHPRGQDTFLATRVLPRTSHPLRVIETES